MTPHFKNTLQNRLLGWYHQTKRSFPWRDAPSPYAVWISEVMLQQTQAERVIPFFQRWMDALPTIRAVACADEELVLKLWEGLGYYRRARNLMLAAGAMLDRHDGMVPDAKKDLLALPGIGEYTAGAILSLAFEHDEPIVDANVERVFARIFDVDSPARENKPFFWDTARALIPKGKARDFNQALMELGALVCGKRPACPDCPLRDMCESHRLGIVHERPVLAKRTDIIPVTVVTGVLRHRDRIFIQKRRPEDVWGGLWEYPGGCPEEGETFRQTIVREYREETGFAVAPTDKITVITHGYTRYRVTLHCYRLELEDSPNGRFPEPVLTEATDHLWASLDQIARRAFPAGHRKLTDMFLADPDLVFA